MAITDKTGINVASGFKLVAPVPIDARFVATDETDLQSLITNNAVYKGLTVWVDSLGKNMVYNGTEFVPIASGSVPENVIELVEVPESIVGKLLPTTELVQLTDEEFAIFEDYENKVYVATGDGTSLFFTPTNRQIMDGTDILLLTNPYMWIMVVYATKQIKQIENPVNSDYRHLATKMNDVEKTLETKVSAAYVDEQLGNIDEVLDEINGGGTTSGGNVPEGGSKINLMSIINIVVTTNTYNDTVVFFQDTTNSYATIFKENHKYEITFDFLNIIRMSITITRTPDRLPVSSPIYGRVNLGSGETGVIGYFDMLQFGELRLNIYQVGQDTNLASAIISSMTFTGVYDLGEYD